MKIYVVAVEALKKKEREEYETQFTIKIGGKTSLGPRYAFDALLCRNWLFLASNRLTLQVTLISCGFIKKILGTKKFRHLLQELS
jgi:hypothetical protein